MSDPLANFFAKKDKKKSARKSTDSKPDEAKPSKEKKSTVGLNLRMLEQVNFLLMCFYPVYTVHILFCLNLLITCFALSDNRMMESGKSMKTTVKKTIRTWRFKLWPWSKSNMNFTVSVDMHTFFFYLKNLLSTLQRSWRRISRTKTVRSTAGSWTSGRRIAWSVDA